MEIRDIRKSIKTLIWIKIYANTFLSIAIQYVILYSQFMSKKFVSTLNCKPIDLISDMKIIEGIAQGEKAVVDGRTLTYKQARKKMQRWLK